MTNLDSIFKSRDITLPTKVRLVKAMVFPVVMFGYESWTALHLVILSSILQGARPEEGAYPLFKTLAQQGTPTPSGPGLGAWMPLHAKEAGKCDPVLS